MHCRNAGRADVLTDPGTGKKRPFTFDYSYNSFIKSDQEGYASNDTVYDNIGSGVLEQAWGGYNVCLFAYGQTGAGKSYSMMGYGEDYGIIPRALKEIFRRIREDNDSAVEYQVESSMMEIYNEQIRDLFNSGKQPKGGLKVRDNPKTGPYVQGLTTSAVSSYEETVAHGYGDCSKDGRVDTDERHIIACAYRLSSALDNEARKQGEKRRWHEYL